MVDVNTFIQLALSFTEAVEKPHFNKRSFCIKERIFAALDEEAHRAVLKLSLVDQAVFCLADEAIYPISGSWGKRGWTVVELAKIKKKILEDALAKAYCNIAPKKLAKQYAFQG